MEEELFEEDNLMEWKVEELEPSHIPLQHSKSTMNLLAGVEPVKKRDLTYDDILGSMNLKVVDGHLQYIQAKKEINEVKQVKLNTAVSPSHSNSSYLNYVPRSREEHQKMMRERIKKQMEARARQQKSTKLFFTNHLPLSQMPIMTNTNYFLQFVKTRPPMR
jgi:hypothetical protein